MDKDLTLETFGPLEYYILSEEDFKDIINIIENESKPNKNLVDLMNNDFN